MQSSERRVMQVHAGPDQAAAGLDGQQCEQGGRRQPAERAASYVGARATPQEVTKPGARRLQRGAPRQHGDLASGLARVAVSEDAPNAAPGKIEHGDGISSPGPTPAGPAQLN